jgi:hypothetical protein
MTEENIDHEIVNNDLDYYGDESSAKESMPKTKEMKSSKTSSDSEDKEAKSITTNEEKEILVDSQDKTVDKDLSELKNTLHETKKWGQKRNQIALSNKRKIEHLVSTLQKDSILSEEDTKNFLSTLDSVDDNDDYAEDNTQVKNTATIRDKLDKEFEVFQRYNKSKDNKNNYQSFYELFPLLSNKQQQEAMVYLEDESPDEALNYVMTHGSDLYQVFGDVANKKGGVIQYVKTLKEEVEKLKKSNLELSSEVDSNTKKVYNKPDSLTKEKDSYSFDDNDYYA